MSKIITMDHNIIKEASTIKLINHDFNKILKKFYQKIEYNFGCTYIFYIREDLINDKKIIYASNWAWQNILIGEKLINECPVIKAGSACLASGQSIVVLPWNMIKSQTSLEKDITLLRNEFNIANGVGLSRSNGLIREGIGLGGDINDTNFFQRMLVDNNIFNLLKLIRELTYVNNPPQILH